MRQVGRQALSLSSLCPVLRQIQREADRQAGRQADRQAGRQAGRQTDRQAGRQADGQTDRQAGRQAGRQAVRRRGRQARQEDIQSDAGLEADKIGNSLAVCMHTAWTAVVSTCWSTGPGAVVSESIPPCSNAA